MLKLNLDMLIVKSFATMDVPPARGTVHGRQVTYERIGSCGPENTCEITVCVIYNTCDVSCVDTECLTACQGGSRLSAAGCGGGGTGGGGGTTGGGTGTDYVGCTNDCTSGMLTAT